MTVCGEGKKPGRQHFLQLAGQSGIREKEAVAIIEEVLVGVSKWGKLAKEYGVSAKSIRQITPFIKENLKNLES